MVVSTNLANRNFSSQRSVSHTPRINGSQTGGCIMLRAPLKDAGCASAVGGLGWTHLSNIPPQAAQPTQTPTGRPLSSTSFRNSCCVVCQYRTPPGQTQPSSMAGRATTHLADALLEVAQAQDTARRQNHAQASCMAPGTRHLEQRIVLRDTNRTVSTHPCSAT